VFAKLGITSRMGLHTALTTRKREATPAAVGGSEHHSATERKRLRRLRPPSPPLEHLPLLIPEHDLSPLRDSRLQSSPSIDFETKQPVSSN